MSSPTVGPKAPAFGACDRFFSITELFTLFLEQCSPQALLNCILVSRTWKTIIVGSSLLQEHLFLKPMKPYKDVRYELNPIIQSHFAPILGSNITCEGSVPQEAIAHLEMGNACSSSDLISMPWARNRSMHAPTRQAFTRREASWRDMLVSQPPIMRLDWWHAWKHDRSLPGAVGGWLTRRVLRREDEVANGWGHQDQSRDYVTLGMLWDLVESRLTRGCTTRVQFFPNGKAVEDDQFATGEEKSWIAEGDHGRRPYAPTTPRVKITTLQIWDKVPWSGAGFDMQIQEWVTMSRLRPPYYGGDGFNTLLADCHYDRKGPSRWSKSEGFRWEGLDGEGSGS